MENGVSVSVNVDEAVCNRYSVNHLQSKILVCKVRAWGRRGTETIRHRTGMRPLRAALLCSAAQVALTMLQTPVRSDLRDLRRNDVDGGLRILPRRRLRWVMERRMRGAIHWREDRTKRG